MGLSLLGLGGSANAGMSGGSSKSSTSQTQANTYTPAETTTQNTLGTLLNSLMQSFSSGGITQPVQAMKTQSADQINKNSTSLSDRLSRFTASRGMGQSGQVGQNQTQVELARQGEQGQNDANYASTQLQQNNAGLLAALNYAFNPVGSATAGTTSSKGSGWSLGVGGSGAFAPAN